MSTWLEILRHDFLLLSREEFYSQGHSAANIVDDDSKNNSKNQVKIQVKIQVAQQHLVGIELRRYEKETEIKDMKTSGEITYCDLKLTSTVTQG